MCFHPEKKAELEAELEALEESISTTSTNDIFSKIRELKDTIAAIPHRFNVGDGAHTSNNGDRYPFRVVEVSKSGKTITVRRMDYKPESDNLPYGHDCWEVFDYPETEDVAKEVYTLRKNGSWVYKGSAMSAYWMRLHPHAMYSYNYHI